MAFANRVMMLMNGAIFLQIAGATPTAGGGGGGGAGAPLPRQPVGIPETIPDITFIANQLPGGNGFIPSANEFHNTYGLTPISVNSLEDILIRLQTATTPIRCMRIVTHADFNNLFLWFFNNATRGILIEQLNGFASSDMDGLRSIISQSFSGGHLIGDATDNALQHLRNTPATQALLVPFGLDQDGSAVTAPMRTFLRRTFDFVALTPGTATDPVAPVNVQTFDHDGNLTGTAPITAAQRTSTQNALRPLINAEAQPLITGAVTAAHVTALQTALLGLNNSLLGFDATEPANVQNINADMINDLREATRAIGAGLRTRINAARARFSKTSRIDIRGCRIAQNGHAYIQAIQRFFGTTGNLPIVTGPNWLQSFPTAYQTVATSGVDGLITSGISGANIAGPDIDSAYTDWRDQMNFGPFLQFINSLIQGTPFDFTTLTWRHLQTTVGGDGIPILNSPAEHADDLPTLALPALIQRFRTFFDINTTTPNTAARTRLGSLQPRVATFAQIKQQVSAAAAPTPANLTTFFNSLKTVYGQLIGVPGVTAPNPRLIPVTAPNPLDLPTIQGYITAIQGFIDTTLTTNYGTFFTDMSTALQGSNAGIKLYLSVGLPLLVQSTTHPAIHRILLDATLKTSAMRNYLRLLWTGDASQVATMTTRINALVLNWDNNDVLMPRIHIPAVHEEHADTDPSAFAPTAAYNNHIVVEPGTP